jgi:hypothetical protein
MTKISAYSFVSQLYIEQIQALFNETGPWKWIDRDNDRWGNYTSASMKFEQGVMNAKLIYEPDSSQRFEYVIDIRFRDDHQIDSNQFDVLHEIVMNKLLPAAQARNIQAVDHYE